MDSQILGDFEIISQLKSAFVRSREKGLANAFLERLCNSVIQASKRIKNETGLFKIHRMGVQMSNGLLNPGNLCLAVKHIHWQFEENGQAGCRVSLGVELETGSSVFETALAKLFDVTTPEIITRFEERAMQLYGQAQDSAWQQ